MAKPLLRYFWLKNTWPNVNQSWLTFLLLAVAI
jgi:hypothetical protein